MRSNGYCSWVTEGASSFYSSVTDTFRVDVRMTFGYTGEAEERMKENGFFFRMSFSRFL